MGCPREISKEMSKRWRKNPQTGEMIFDKMQNVPSRQTIFRANNCYLYTIQGMALLAAKPNMDMHK